MVKAWLFSAILHLALVASTAGVAAVPSPPAAADGGIASTMQEMQQARYFTFVTLVRMVQKMPQNTTFLMPSDRMLSTASVPENQVLDLLLRHSIPAILTFSDLNRLPNRTILPTRHASQTITVTKREEQQRLYLNNVELTGPDICHGGELFRCHGIDGVMRPTTTTTTRSRGRGSTCAPTTAAPEPASAANQSLGTPSLTSSIVGSAISPALEPAAENPQKSGTSIAQPRLSCATLMIVLMLSIV